MSIAEILTLLEDGRLIRTSDLDIYGLHRVSLATMVKKGLLHTPARGVYVRSDIPKDSLFDLAVVSLKIPQGSWGLESALAIHLGTPVASPFWIRLPRGKMKYPRISEYSLSFLTRDSSMFSCATRQKEVHGVSISYTDFANTIAEFCVFRNRVGLPSFLHALRVFVCRPEFDYSDFLQVCRFHRVEKAILPYLYSILNSL